MTDEQWAMLKRFPLPWRVCGSKGGKTFIYAEGQEMPVFTMHVRGFTPKQRTALLELIAEAVNEFGQETV
jgi:hypothetical protein